MLLFHMIVASDLNLGICRYLDTIEDCGCPKIRELELNQQCTEVMNKCRHKEPLMLFNFLGVVISEVEESTVESESDEEDDSEEPAEMMQTVFVKMQRRRNILVW